nr:uncharacterized protein LOC115254678 [Aedes albopictus]
MWRDDVNNKNAKLILEVLRQNGSQKYTVNYPERPTYVGSNRKASYLDICLANFAVSKPTVIQKLSSDHYPVIYEIGSGSCDETCVQKESIIKKENCLKYASYLKSALESIKDTNLALEVLCQAVETIAPSRVKEIADEARKIILKMSEKHLDPIKEEPRGDNDVQRKTSLTDMPGTANLQPDQKLILSTFLKALQPSLMIFFEKCSAEMAHGHLINNLRQSLAKYRAWSPTEALFTLRQVLQKCREFDVPTHHLFISLKSSYATIDRDRLWKKIQESYRWPESLFQLLRGVVDTTNPDPRVGLQQGHPLSSVIMTLALDVVIQATEIKASGTIFEKSFQCICFADDLDLIAKNSTELEQVYTKLKAEAKKIGLVFDTRDTKYMQAGFLKNSSAETKITLDGDEFEVVEKFEFLKSTFTSDNDLEKEIDHRIEPGISFLKKLDEAQKPINMEDVYRSQIRPEVLYGHETWILNKTGSVLKKLQEFECEVLRTIYGKQRTEDGKSYEDTYPNLLHRFGDLGIEHTVKVGRLRWVGRVKQMGEDCPARIVLDSEPQVTRPKRRPPTRWIECVVQDLRNVKCYTNWQAVVQYPEQWNKLVDKAHDLWLKRIMKKKGTVYIQSED